MVALAGAGRRVAADRTGVPAPEFVGLAPALAVAAVGLGAVIAAGWFAGELLNTTEPINEVALSVAGVERPSDAVPDSCPSGQDNQPWYAIAAIAGLPLILIGGVLVHLGAFVVVPLALIATAVTAFYALVTRISAYFSWATAGLGGGAIAVIVGAGCFRLMDHLGSVGCPGV